MIARRLWLQATLALTLCACAGSPSGFRGLDVSSGTYRTILPQPAMQSVFAGVYRSPQLGVIELWQHDEHVEGQFQYARGTAHVTGALTGSVTGNWLRFRWSEVHQSPTYRVQKRGRGEFFYDPALATQPRARLFGKRDYTSELGPPQKNFQQRVLVDGGPLTALRMGEPTSHMPVP